MRTRSQRLLSMVLALSMLLTFLPVSAFADDTPPSYSVSNADPQPLDNNGTYTDRSNNENNEYKYALNTDGTATLTKFTGKHANVPKEVTKGTETYEVTAIGEYAFANSDHTPNPTLKSVNLPDPSFIQTIEDYAFYGCTSLSDITLPEGLTKVGIFAFCFTSLETIDWPKSLTTVGAMAFHNMTDYSQGNSAPSPKPIKTITYHGTKAQWDEMANDQGFATTNPQLLDATLHYTPTVTFDKNGHGDPEEQVVKYEGYATEPKEPKADGYTFKYWFTKSENGEEKEFNFGTKITEDTKLYAHWEEEEKKPAPTPEQPGTPEKPNEPTTPAQPGTQEKPNEPNPPQNPDNNKPGTPEKPNEPTTPDVPAVEEDDTAAIGYAAAAVTAAFVGWGAYRIGSEVYLKYLLPKDVLLPQNRIQLAELLWEDAGRPAPADAAAYTDVDANDADARQAARWAVENGLLTLPDTEKPEEFVPYRSVSYAKSARAWNQAQQLKENAAAR